ncbi:hypothetical protein NLX83_07560 [Allokutzneria sp. A3M-2-11 16]|uniref:hypothetical protein n=1 Tax=Allokutzneria sp. A3M-2-11 16 TaxID=2962043 RepID=UPI0020B71B98|nr:hypothetical protein [Allokutzneria sp. A3M-2-11 16]MCP3799109.1 hypothetical protein [Allokutzneria sp. A3M-2-11 16]
MSGYEVKPDALLGYADGCDSLAGKFDQLERLLLQSKVDDQCFGPLAKACGATTGYELMLDLCRELAKGAGAYLRHTSSGLHATHAIYNGTESGLSQGFSALGKDVQA